MACRKLLAFSVISILAVCIPPSQAEILIGGVTAMTGRYAWLGERLQNALELALADLHAQGGVLGQEVKLVLADDYCHAEQAVAAANKLVSDGVVLVVGHQCSAAAIPASIVYQKAGIVFISPSATNPVLTERGLGHVFRVTGRDDRQGQMAAQYLSEHWADKNIAILHDGQVYGRGLARETKKQLNARGVREALYAEVTPSLLDYTGVLQQLETAEIDVLYYAGYSPEAALIISQARARGLNVQLVSGDGLSLEDFWLIAGQAGEGALFTRTSNPADSLGISNTTYAAVQVWAQAVERVGTAEPKAVAEALHAYKFDTVFGKIGFDGKGDVTGYETFIWYIWKNGNHAPLEKEATDTARRP